ncbi:MAG: POTRA domain-containing protein [Ferruginibacter sp.]
MICCVIAPSLFAQPAEPDPYKLPLIDSSAKIVLDSVSISGNKKTKKYIIIREMKIKKGDSIIAATLADRLKESQELIYNTNLFSDVTLTPRFITARNFVIDIVVKERWYIYPTPQFQLTDRNYNEWINRYNADLDRVIYGIKFAHYNLSGRRDQLRIYLLNGFARNFAISYSSPYSNRKLTEGFGVFGGFSQSRDVTFRSSSNNLPVRYSTPEKGFVRNSFNIGASYLSRRGYFKRHFYTASYNYLNVTDSVANFYNPSFYKNGDRSHIGFIDVGYTFQYIRTNNINYPLTGKTFSISAVKRGFGFSGKANMLSMSGAYNRYLSLGKKWYHAFQGSGFLRLPFDQPYINQTGMGYGDFYLRGLEDYVIDGVFSVIGKYTLRRQLVSFNIPVPIKNKIVSSIPFKIFAKTFGDAGYTYNKYGMTGRLGNRLLYTGGFGIDILSLYDINVGLEYSFNQLGQKGLFLHLKGGF